MLSLREGLQKFYASGCNEVRRRIKGRNAEAHQLSMSNGIVGTEAMLKAQMAIDAKLGVPINYVKTHERVNYKGEKVAAYRAEFFGRSHKNRWLRAHGRFDADAGYGDPAPGYTHGKYQQEFPE